MRGLSIADRRKRQAEWLREHGIMFEDTDAGIDRSFTQARQNRSRAEKATGGDSARAEAERRRRDAEREHCVESAAVRPSSEKRMKRRAESEEQTLRQLCYNSQYAERQRRNPLPRPSSPTPRPRQIPGTSGPTSACQFIDIVSAVTLCSQNVSMRLTCTQVQTTTHSIKLCISSSK